MAERVVDFSLPSPGCSSCEERFPRSDLLSRHRIKAHGAVESTPVPARRKRKSPTANLASSSFPSSSTSLPTPASFASSSAFFGRPILHTHTHSGDRSSSFLHPATDEGAEFSSSSERSSSINNSPLDPNIPYVPSPASHTLLPNFYHSESFSNPFNSSTYPPVAHPSSHNSLPYPLSQTYLPQPSNLDSPAAYVPHLGHGYDDGLSGHQWDPALNQDVGRSSVGTSRLEPINPHEMVRGAPGWEEGGDWETSRTLEGGWEVVGSVGGPAKQQELWNPSSNQGGWEDRRVYSSPGSFEPRLLHQHTQPSPNLVSYPPAPSLADNVYTSSSSSSSYPSTSTSSFSSASVYSSRSLPPPSFFIPPPPSSSATSSYPTIPYDGRAQEQRLEDHRQQRLDSCGQALDSLLTSFPNLPHQTISSNAYQNSFGGSRYELSAEIPSSQSTGRVVDQRGNWSDGAGGARFVEGGDPVSGTGMVDGGGGGYQGGEGSGWVGTFE